MGLVCHCLRRRYRLNSTVVMSVSVQPRPNHSPNASKEKRYPWTCRKSSRRRNMTPARHRLLDLTTNFRGSRNGPHTARRESSCCHPLEYITDGRLLSAIRKEGRWVAATQLVTLPSMAPTPKGLRRSRAKGRRHVQSEAF